MKELQGARKPISKALWGAGMAPWPPTGSALLTTAILAHWITLGSTRPPAIPRPARTRAHAPARRVLLPMDYCVFELTGAIGSDPIAAVGLVDRNGYVAPLLDIVPRAAELLPPLFPFHHVAGRVRPGLPCAGVPVVVGAMDAWGG